MPTQDSKSKTQDAIEVAAALVFRNRKLLITRRQPKAHLGGLWEFPGGKREAGESFEACLTREIREELGVPVSIGRLFAEITHAYAERTVHLKFFLCEIPAGEPRPLGCAAVRWIGKPELADYDFPAADARLLDKLRACAFP